MKSREITKIIKYHIYSVSYLCLYAICMYKHINTISIWYDSSKIFVMQLFNYTYIKFTNYYGNDNRWH